MKINASRKLIVALLGLTAMAAQADVVVVVSAKSAAAGLNADQVSQIFLGKTNTFPSGEQAVPIDQTDGSNVRNEFYTKVAGKDSAQVKAYWSKQVFTGKSRPPKEVANNGEVKKLVADNPNLIGYIDKSAVDGSVKVVLTP